MKQTERERGGGGGGGGREIKRKQKWKIAVAGYKVPLTFAQYSMRFNQAFTCNITMTFHLKLRSLIQNTDLQL